MLRIITTTLTLLAVAPAYAQSISSERQAGMVPWIVRDREQAMNEKALCNADFAAANVKINDLQAKLDAAYKKIDDLSPKPDGP